MSTKTITTLADAKKKLNELGYKTRTITHSAFKSLKVLSTDGQHINAGNALTPEHYDRHKAFYEYKETVSVRDGDWIVTL